MVFGRAPRRSACALGIRQASDAARPRTRRSRQEPRPVHARTTSQMLSARTSSRPAGDSAPSLSLHEHKALVVNEVHKILDIQGG